MYFNTILSSVIAYLVQYFIITQSIVFQHFNDLPQNSHTLLVNQIFASNDTDRYQNAK